MSNFLKKIVVFLGVVVVASAITSFANSASTSADIMGMPEWHKGVADEIHSESDLEQNIMLIVSNIVMDASVIAGYLILGYVIYGGYLYMFSSGDANKAATGKKALIHAFIGIAIVICAYTIFGSIRIALIGNGKFADCSMSAECIKPEEMVSNLIGWIGGIAGAVCAIFIVVGAWGYITASGDSAKLQKAKNSIMYALIGLLIIAFAEILTAFITSTIRNSNQSRLNSDIAININKEQHEIN